MPFATFSDVETDLGDLDDQAQVKVGVLLERAHDRLLQVFPDIEQRIAAGRTTVVLAVQVESEMVASVLRNPNALQSESQTIGGLSSSRTINLAVASGMLRLTEDHREMLGEPPTRTVEAAAGRSSTIYSLPLSTW